MASRWSKAACVAAATASLVSVTACGGGSSEAGSASGEKVTVEFWGAAIGLDKSVALWNKSHPNVQVKYSQIPPGSSGGYSKMQNAVKAGNAPCLGQVGYDTMPTFVATGAVADVSEYANASKDQFVPWAWQMASVGEKVFGIPTDIGPMALYYRADLYKKFGITPPKTWDEFAAAAQKVHAASPTTHLAATPQDAYDMGALTWQAGGKWFGTANDQWQVTIDSAETQKVADYWQGLLDKKLAATEPPFDTSWFKGVQEGRILSLVGAVWAVPLISSNLPDLAGKWAVAPLPQWTAASSAAGNRGGSALAVLKGCKNPKEATEFAVWFNSNPESVTSLIQNTGIYPAAKSGMDLPAANQPSKYFGGQDIYQVFKAAAGNISTDWRWGPTMTQVQSDFKDELKKAAAGQGSMQQAVSTLQTNTVTTMTGQGLAVAK
ncbi:ABC transporter substrate-binding protein [Terrabacter sp. GCM10028922]|uniref:ABC transporter substrate-binding protein n=1 Tax=Terrabacter sp. GCM10028922 TaxID=3273428 RepID=UPI00360A3F27